MNKLTLAALSGTALLALAACEQSEPVDAEEEIVTETAVDTLDPVDSMPAEETGDSVTIGEEGVDAQINDGDTSITADVDEDPSMTVETE